VSQSASSAVVSGAIFQSHTTDGEHFLNGGPVLCPAQDIGVIPGSDDFALLAQCTKGQGVYRSSDGGATYAAVTIPETLLNATYEIVRYGAFPSATTWYVTAGTFPNTNSARRRDNEQRQRRRVTHRLTVGADHFEFNADHAAAPQDGPVDCSADPMNCFSAAIVKTTDAGKTWTKVYENINTGDNIYANGIHCASEDHCVAVVEGDTSRILLTRDGGKTWKEARHDDDKASSLVAVRMLDEKEGWVSGGEMSNAFEGRFWHTLDGGDTWVKEAIKGLYTFSFDMVSSGFVSGPEGGLPAFLGGGCCWR
jgi:hypothetical protein